MKDKRAADRNTSNGVNVDELVDRAYESEKIYAEFSQAQVDEIFKRAAIAANAKRIYLAKLAAQETGMGIVEDKVIKNHFAAEYVYNKYRDAKTCGVIEENITDGIAKIAEPLGVIAGIIPVTNPTSTTIFKTLLALKTRNAIVFSPHPRAKKSTCEAAEIMYQAARSAGAPQGLIGWVEEPTVEKTRALMHHPRIAIILATGGQGMVKAAYTSGKPAIGVGAGNTPVLIDETADLRMAVTSILMSKTFDNGTICSSEQSVVVLKNIADETIDEFRRQGAHFLKDDDIKRLSDVAIDKERQGMSPAIVGQSACKIAHIAGISVPDNTKVLIAKLKEVGPHEPLSQEKLSPILGFYTASTYEEAISICKELVSFGGTGHTVCIYSTNEELIRRFRSELKTGRVLVNMPASQGAIGDIYNFKLEPSLTLGCGSWGGNSVSENVGVRHLLNIKSVAYRRENMLWFKVPPRIYFKAGCLSFALKDLAGKKKALIVTDAFLAASGTCQKVTDILSEIGLRSEVYSNVEPDPTITTVENGLKLIRNIQPDVIIGLGGGSPMDAAKIMWLMYECPKVKFESLALRFMDIRKRVYNYPELGKKAIMVAIPTTSGTGSEVTPVAVITDPETNIKYPLVDYELTPDMAIVDVNLAMTMPKGLTAASGMDALVHAIEAYVSVLATEYTDGLALKAIKMIFENLPAAYHEGNDIVVREKMHHAATIAGMAFANAFLGICHSMAHKLGSMFNIPHGLANALLIGEVIRYNAEDAPNKYVAFPQYERYKAGERYAEISDYLGLGGPTTKDKVHRLIDKIEELKDKINIPKSIKEAGVEEEKFFKELDELSESAFDDQCTGANPRYPLIEEIKGIYSRAFSISKNGG